MFNVQMLFHTFIKVRLSEKLLYIKKMQVTKYLIHLKGYCIYSPKMNKPNFFFFAFILDQNLFSVLYNLHLKNTISSIKSVYGIIIRAT
uniref:Uncharacterized protein n=1 Tax=Anguilla anguilla TaxID=7936 RepID=A0A0E9XGE6_ANGAN